MRKESFSEIPLASKAIPYKRAVLFIASEVHYDPVGFFLTPDEGEQLRNHCGGMPFRTWNAHDGITNPKPGVFIENRFGDVEKVLNDAGLVKETDERITVF